LKEADQAQDLQCNWQSDRELVGNPSIDISARVLIADYAQPYLAKSGVSGDAEDAGRHDAARSGSRRT